MQEVIVCKKCSKEISSKKDLVVTMEITKIVPYHKECFSQISRKTKSIFLGTPINSASTNISIIMGWIASIYVLSLDIGAHKLLLPIAMTVATFARLLSWYKYERRA